MRMRVKALGRAWPAAALAIVYLWAFPYFGKLKSANELPRVLLAQEIVRGGTFKLDARLGELGSRFDISVVPGGGQYSNKAPGVSMLGAPVVAVADVVAGGRDGRASVRVTTWALRVFVVTVPCLLLMLGWWWLAGRMVGGGAGAGAAEGAGAGAAEGARRTALVAYALGSMALPYGILFFSHALAGALAGAAFVLAVRVVRGAATAGRRAALETVACGLCAGGAVLVDYQALLAAVAVAAYVAACAPGALAARVRTLALAAAGAVPPMLALCGYHWACYGSPWKTGYSFAADQAHKQGVLGVIGPNGEAMWNALLAPDNGLVVLAPWVLLAAVGAVVGLRDGARRAETMVCVAVAVVYVLFVGSLVPEFGRAGWSVGPRYIGVAMPFFAWLAAAGLSWCWRRPAARAAAGALVVAGVVVHVAAATTYPHWPTSFAHPLYEVSFRALGLGMVPHSLGTAAGLKGIPSILPLWAAAAALVFWALGVRPRRALPATLAALALGAALVAAYSAFPRTPATDFQRPWRFVQSSWEP